MFENKGEGWEKLEKIKSEAEFRQAYENPWPSPEDKPRMIFVVAGDMRQAKQWAREHGIAPPHWKAVLSPVDIEGARDSVFVRIGTFYQREKASEIRDLLTLYENNGYLREIKDE